MLRITKEEAKVLRKVISEKKASLGRRQAAIIGFAKMFGKFLPEYECIKVGKV